VSRHRRRLSSPNCKFVLPRLALEQPIEGFVDEVLTSGTQCLAKLDLLIVAEAAVNGARC
jgi:hypothetical protein